MWNEGIKRDLILLGSMVGEKGKWGLGVLGNLGEVLEGWEEDWFWL